MTRSTDLQKKIDEFKGKISLTNDYMVLEPNSFDIFLDKALNFLNFLTKVFNFFGKKDVIKLFIPTSYTEYQLFK